MIKIIISCLALMLMVSLTACVYNTESPVESPREIIQFGEYDWRVLDVQDDRALIITEKIIDIRAYHNELTDITWADCDLREYLNGEFYNNFNANDKARIIQVTNSNHYNYWYRLEGGLDTDDHIFLLSLDEVINKLHSYGLDLKIKED